VLHFIKSISKLEEQHSKLIKLTVGVLDVHLFELSGALTACTEPALLQLPLTAHAQLVFRSTAQNSICSI
jgi:hypothetical protein